MIAILLSLLVVSGATAEARAAGESHASETLTIQVQKTKPQWAVSVLHDGPYWSIGKKFAEVRAYMVREGLEAPMFVRHAADERRVLGTGPMEIGVFADGRRDPSPPFRAAYWPEALAVVTEVPARRFNVHRVSAKLRDWIEQSKYVAAGPLVEVYPATPVGGFAPRTVEVWMAIEEKPAKPDIARRTESDRATAQAPTEASPDAPSTSPPPSRGADVGDEPGDVPSNSAGNGIVADQQFNAEGTKAELQREAVERIENRIKRLQEAARAASESPSNDVNSAEQSEPESAPDSSDSVARDEATGQEPKAPEPSGTSRSQPPAANGNTGAPARGSQVPQAPQKAWEAKHSANPNTCPPRMPRESWKPIGELIASGESGAIARQIVACPGEVSDEIALWTAQFAIRTENLVRAFERIFPSAAEPLRPVADALAARVALAGPELQQRAISELPAAIVTPATGIDDGRSALMQDMDRLLTDLMTRRVSATAAGDRFAGILERARRLLHASGS